MQGGGVDKQPISGAFDNQGVVHGSSDEGGLDKGGGGAVTLDGGRDEESWDVVLVLHIPIWEMLPSPLACHHLHVCRPRHCLISW